MMKFQVDLPFFESTAAGSAEYCRLLYLHLAERHSNIGSTLMRQFCINAIPMLAIKIFEFQMIQVHIKKLTHTLSGRIFSKLY